jgi:D-isomer specific 2-hydroxyacid dehydrogenase-like protein
MSGGPPVVVGLGPVDPAGVGLDVFDPEPPAPHPLYEHPDVVLTPHLMGLSRRPTAATFTATGPPRRGERERVAS